MSITQSFQKVLKDSSEMEDDDERKGLEDLNQTIPSIPGTPFQKPKRTESWMVKDKLSKEFKTGEDQDELGNLIGDAGEKLLALVDDIRKIDKLRIDEQPALDLPQVISVSSKKLGTIADTTSWLLLGIQAAGSLRSFKLSQGFPFQ